MAKFKEGDHVIANIEFIGEIRGYILANLSIPVANQVNTNDYVIKTNSNTNYVCKEWNIRLIDDTNIDKEDIIKNMNDYFYNSSSILNSILSNVEILVNNLVLADKEVEDKDVMETNQSIPVDTDKYFASFYNILRYIMEKIILIRYNDGITHLELGNDEMFIEDLKQICKSNKIFEDLFYRLEENTQNMYNDAVKFYHRFKHKNDKIYDLIPKECPWKLNDILCRCLGDLLEKLPCN